MRRSHSWIWAWALNASCLLPAEDRVELDRKVGRTEAAGMRVEVEEGLAGVRSFDGERLELWAQAPVLRLHVAIDTAERGPRPLQLTVLNCMREALLQVDRGSAIVAMPVDERSAGCAFAIEVTDGSTLQLSPAGAGEAGSFVFAVLSDVQRAVDRVGEIFARMNDDPELAFVVSTGDLVNTGARQELSYFQEQMAPLSIPLFSTVGNHEMGAPASAWHELFGPFNLHFRFKQVAFSFVDSGNATIDPQVYGWLDGWLSEARAGTHVVLTHVPPIDPAGLRGGSFRSRKEAAKLLQKLGEGEVDALFLGHIHSYYAFSAAGVPSYISGGGGAIPETLDGIDRHYLRVRASPERGIEDVAVVRVD
jgi:3',5'-cyclic-AMP phosphodiesterase